MLRSKLAIVWNASALVIACSSSNDTTADSATPTDSSADAATTDAATTDVASTDVASTDAATADAATTDAATTDAATTDAATTDASSDASTPAWLSGTVSCGSATCAAGQLCLYFTNVDPPQGPRCSSTLTGGAASGCASRVDALCHDALAMICGTSTLSLNASTRHLTCCFGSPAFCPTL